MQDERTGLRCLEGKDAPPGLEEDVRLIRAFSGPLRTSLWSAVERTLADPVPAQTSQLLDAAARAAGAEPAPYAAAVSAMRAIYRFAATLDLSAEDLAADISKLLGEPDPSMELLFTSTYELARRRVQAELAQKTFDGHGKTLVDMDWRLEIVTHSKYGRGFKLPIVTLTFVYEERGQRSAITLHALPTLLKRVRDTLSSIVA